jgi:hypothetical protein
MMEERGTPATVVITEPFQTLIATHAAKLGAPGFHSVTVPHPVYGKTEAELQQLASTMVDRAVAQLTADVASSVPRS